MRAPLMMHRAAVVAVLFACASGPALGAGLRAYSQVSASSVRLSNLFDDLGATPDRVLGPAPAPGERISVDAPQLAAIARDFAVDWRPASGAERAVLERAATRVNAETIIAALRIALAAAGAASDADLVMPGFEPPMVPAGETVVPEISQVAYEPASARFTASLVLAPHDMPAITVHLSGQAFAVVYTAVLTHRLSPGALLGAGDVAMARVRGSLLHGNATIQADGIVGEILRRDVPAGVPLAASDMGRPVLVTRGAPVRMTLDAAGIALSAQGIALEAGSLHERIRVQNPLSHAVVEAVVTADGEVRVVPGAPVAYISLASAP